MAKVKITGHASGSGVITVTAPNTSTDRTITLPDATATIATTVDVAARLPSITDGGNATAITITSDENIGIGTGSPETKLTIDNDVSTAYSASGYAATVSNSMLYLNNTNGGSNKASLINFRVGSGDGLLGFVSGSTNECDFVVATDGGSNGVERLRVTNDGRGLSQFTAKFWIIFRTTSGGNYFRDSHNVSSITDHAVGDITINLTNNMGNAEYAVVASAGAATTNPSDKNVGAVPVNAGSARLEIYNVASTGAGAHYDMEYISALGFGD